MTARAPFTQASVRRAIKAAHRQGLRVRGIRPDGLLTYVWDAKVKSEIPGYCFRRAGWKRIGRSADGRKTLLRKHPNQR